MRISCSSQSVMMVFRIRSICIELYMVGVGQLSRRVIMLSRSPLMRRDEYRNKNSDGDRADGNKQLLCFGWCGSMNVRFGKANISIEVKGCFKCGTLWSSVGEYKEIPV